LATNQKVGSSNLSGRATSAFFVYVLRNTKTGRHYTGFTANLEQRLGQHNYGVSKSTKNRGAWELVHTEAFATRAEAMRRERFLKSGQGREELKRILQKGSAGNSAG
jgi:putative endonuclease